MVKLSKDEKKLEGSTNDTIDDFAMVMKTKALLSVTDPQQKQRCIFDSGATSHICISRDAFETFTAQICWVQVGNRECISSYGTGNIRVSTRVDGITYTVLLTDVTFASDVMFKQNYKRRVRKAGYKIITDNDHQDPRKGDKRIMHRKCK